MILAFLAVAAALMINSSLAGLAERLFPQSVLWVHAGLLLAEILAFFWFWRGIFGRQRHLILLESHTPEEREQTARELVRRLRGNPLIREAGLDPADPNFTERSLALLEEKANLEIRQTAQKIFLATALSQNGRLDALIVFIALCRLIWRVSGMYNQQPHPGEIVSLYTTVASNAFLAFSLEELDIATEISVGFAESFQAMAPAAMTGGIPFAGSALTTFTASTIDGAANCYLTLRAGIITRNAYAYAARDVERPGRAAVFKEAGALLLTMSQGLVERLAGAMKDNIKGLTRLAGQKGVAVGKGIAHGAVRMGDGIVDGVVKVGDGIVDGACKVGDGIVDGVVKVGDGIVDGACKVGDGIVDGACKVGGGLSDSASLLAQGAGKAVQVAGTGIRQAGTGVKRVGSMAGTGLAHVEKVASETGKFLGTPFRRKKNITKKN